MDTFALLSIEVTGQVQKISKLEINGRCPFDDFCSNVKKSGRQEDLVRIQTFLDELSHGKLLPPKKWKQIRGVDQNDSWKDFELKEGRLRIYAFYYPPKHLIVVYGELKKDDKQQQKTIGKLREIKSRFRNQQNIE